VEPKNRSDYFHIPL